MQCHLEVMAAMQVKRQLGATVRRDRSPKESLRRVSCMRSLSGRVHGRPCGNPLSYKRRSKATVHRLLDFLLDFLLEKLDSRKESRELALVDPLLGPGKEGCVVTFVPFH